MFMKVMKALNPPPAHLKQMGRPRKLPVGITEVALTRPRWDRRAA
jgi:hypothetical protein